jgi:hypothetical protein
VVRADGFDVLGERVRRVGAAVARLGLPGGEPRPWWADPVVEIDTGAAEGVLGTLRALGRDLRRAGAEGERRWSGTLRRWLGAVESWAEEVTWALAVVRAQTKGATGRCSAWFTLEGAAEARAVGAYHGAVVGSVLAELGDPADPARLVELGEAVSGICPGQSDPVYSAQVLSLIGPEGLRRTLDLAWEWRWQVSELATALYRLDSLLSAASWSAMLDPELIPAVTRGCPGFLRDLTWGSYPADVALELAAALLSRDEDEPGEEGRFGWDVYHNLVAACRMVVSHDLAGRVTDRARAGGDPGAAFVARRLVEVASAGRGEEGRVAGVAASLVSQVVWDIHYELMEWLGPPQFPVEFVAVPVDVFGGDFEPVGRLLGLLAGAVPERRGMIVAGLRELAASCVPVSEVFPGRYQDGVWVGDVRVRAVNPHRRSDGDGTVLSAGALLAKTRAYLEQVLFFRLYREDKVREVLAPVPPRSSRHVAALVTDEGELFVPEPGEPAEGAFRGWLEDENPGLALLLANLMSAFDARLLAPLAEVMHAWSSGLAPP